MELGGLGKLSVPLGVVMMAATAAYGGYQHIDSRYLRVTDFKMFQTQMELRLLNTQRHALETDVLRLSIKRDAYPKSFDAVDKAVLAKQEATLVETVGEIKKLEDRQRQ